MGRNRTPASKLHRHCESCHSRRCKTPIEISVSCAIINCRLLCGAIFHLCKEEEHVLLCPNEKVPCINADFGCPFTMCRSRLAKHLGVCPASVVCCSMEWNRWPTEDKNAVFYENVIKEAHTQEPLDLSMALRDQRHLFQSLKMKAVFPELIEKAAEEAPPLELEGAVGGAVGGPIGDAVGGAVGEVALPEEEQASASTGEATCMERELTQEEREALARNATGEKLNMENYNVWERMFSMEMGGCNQAVKALESDQTPLDVKYKKAQRNRLETLEEEPQPCERKTSDASTFVDVPRYNAGEMDEEKYLIETSLFRCSTNPNKKFAYDRLLPMKIKIVRTFKIPTSFRERHTRIRNAAFHIKRISQSVDTSDLGVDIEDLPKWDEVQASLQCSLEKELRGRLAADCVSTDALLIDVGTQTYDFYSAPFKRDSSLADITADRPLKLHLQIQTEGVTGRHNKSSSAFTYLCGHLFRRDEFASHFRNVHSDIQSSLSGWFEQRCPLAYLGCTFIQKRFQPTTQRATVSYDQDLSTFTLRPEVPALLYEGVKMATLERKRARNVDSLSRLPFEVLLHMAELLDSFTLSQLALVSQLMRDVCATLLHERGMVSLKWEKKTYSHGGFCWRSRKKVWQYSNLFSPVNKWCFDNFPPISEHLKVCPYYHREESKPDPVFLTGIFDCNDEEVKTQSLVSMLLK